MLWNFQFVIRRLWLLNRWPSSWGRGPAQLGRVGRTRSNTGRFWVGGSRCGPRQARLRKTCYHSCDTDTIRESKRFYCFVEIGPPRVFSREMKISVALESVKISHRNKTACSKSNPVQGSRSKSMTCPTQIQIEQHSNFRGRRAKAWKWRPAWFWIDCNQSLQPNRSQMKCDLPQERVSAQIRIDQHSDFRWRRAKAWKRCLAWLWNDCIQSLQSNWSQMKCDIWTPCGDQRWQDKLRFFDHQLSLFEVDELLEEQSPKIVRNENISTQIYVECYKMYRSKVCFQEFWYFVPGLDI